MLPPCGHGKACGAAGMCMHALHSVASDTECQIA